MSYSQRLIAFVDILGFGDLVEESQADSTKFQLILDVLEKIRAVDDVYASPETFFAHSNYHMLSKEQRLKLLPLYETSKEEAAKDRVEITTFSDSIVFSVPANEAGLLNFRYFLIKLFVYTSKFSLLLRGGISCGSLVHTNGNVFGPAMNRAYYTESKISIYPRISLDNNAIDFLESVKSTSIGKTFGSEIIIDRKDGVHFINSLDLSTNKVAENLCGAKALNVLVNVKDNVIELASNNKENQKVMEKLNWFASYFNDYLNNNPEVEVSTSNWHGMPFESVSVPEDKLEINLNG